MNLPVNRVSRWDAARKRLTPAGGLAIIDSYSQDADAVLVRCDDGDELG
jgi:hypothetical protein